MVSSQNMVKYVVKRIVLMIPTIILVLMFTWILSQMMSGDPTTQMFPIGTPPETINYYRDLWGLNDPWYKQFYNYIIRLLQGDLGDSYVVSPGVPVATYIKTIFPRTIELVIVPTIIAPIIAVKLGVLSAKNRNKPVDSLIRGMAVAAVAVPIYWFAMMLQLFFGWALPEITGGKLVLPTFNYKTPGFPEPVFVTGFRLIDCIIGNNQDLLMDQLKHMILPVFCNTAVSLAGITRITRSSMLEVLQQDYIRTARAKGCSKNTVYNKHALRNAIIPTSTLIVLGIAGSLTGSFFIETTFNYNGLGRAMLNSILYKDYFMINGVLLFISFIILIGYLVADIMYTIIDPRITYS